MKKNKKKVKGMTLVEMIISIAIFGIMGGLLILVGTHVDATSRAGNNLKNKVLNESPYAANHVKTYMDGEEEKDIPKSKMDIEIRIPDVEGKYYKTEDDGAGGTKEVEYNYGPGIDVTLKTYKYDTEAVITKDMTDEQIEDMKKKANGKLNLKFFDVVDKYDDEEEAEAESPFTPPMPK
jgi:prepilin-type N-terminal cleavage/methylation domain-containing protein